MNIGFTSTFKGFRFALGVFLMLGVSYQSVAQEIDVEVVWKEPVSTNLYGVTIQVPCTKTEEYENQLPVFSRQEKFLKGHFDVEVNQVQSVSANEIDKIYLNHIQVLLPNQPQITGAVSNARNESFLVAKCQPFFIQNGEIRKVTNFKLKVVAKPSVGTSSMLKSYVGSSVLSTGEWYKIAVTNNGIYKLDKAFFKQMGVDVSEIHPDWINVYGNADGMLSEYNNGPYSDDLKKNAIQFVGNNDTLFADDEYFLFYGVGPNLWKPAGVSDFNRTMHTYSTVNHYFIRIDASEAPLRIQQLAESNLPQTHLVTSYNYYDIYEQEQYNLVQGGQRWYGDVFDAILTKDYTFNIPGLDLSSPLRVEYAVASNGRGSTVNTMVLSYNGSVVHSKTLTNVGEDYIRDAVSLTISPNSINNKLTLTLNRANASVKAYLDYIKIHGRRNLRAYGNFVAFRDLVSVGPGHVSEFQIAGMTNDFKVWDVSDRTNPRHILGELNAGVFSFKQATDTLREFVVFNTSYLTPTFVKAVENQNLHALEQYDYLVVSPKKFLSQAQRLVNLHQATGLSAIAVDVEQIYNEYSSGNQDATAIRRFVKMFYDRAAGDVSLQPKYLCLFGDATYDPKNRVANNNYMIPTYEFHDSENHIAAVVTDDYFGLLDDNESIQGTDMMDIGVGRLLISNATHAKTQVDKIEHYMKNGINSPIQSDDPNSCCVDELANTFGDWRQVYTNVADDQDAGQFVKNDAEKIYDLVQGLYNEMNNEKLYLDAYTQVSTAGGHRYPDVVSAIDDRVERGSLIINYIGHGSEYSASAERVITIPQVNAWKNLNRMGLFVSATCEFTKFDDPSKESIGELISLNPTGGAIAMMTTTRAIYVSVNTTLLLSLFSHVLERDVNHDPLTFGEIMRRTKNTSGSGNNRRCFNLVGDPALRISLPKWRVVTDSINHVAVNMGIDTVKALTKMHVVGHIEDYNGNKLTNFNGVLSPTVFDKKKTVSTLGNDPESPLLLFDVQKNALYKGRATVKNGDFKFEFIVPKDIDYNYGRGKISYYANNLEVDADGWDTSFYVGGMNPNPPIDNEGPQLKIYLNDDSFVDGSIASPNPLLVVEAYDDFGINTVGNGIGHDITAILDGNTGNPIVLNDYYKSNLDSYQSGKVQYTLKNLSVGPHTLDVKVWDVNNNSSTIRLEFTVVDNEDVELDHVLNYPNPFTTRTTFMFEHNQSCSHLETQIQIFTVSGRLVKTINQLVPTNGFRVEGIEWDGRDDFGDQLAKGVYVYRLTVTMPDGKKAQKLEKLVLLK